MQKWKKILIDLLGINVHGKGSGGEIGIGIEEVMEKVVIRLHGK